MSLLDKWKESVVTVYDSQEMSTLELIEDITNFNDEIARGIDILNEGKTDINGDHKGSWQGLSRPTLSNEGMRATVENISTQLEHIAIIPTKLNVETDYTNAINRSIQTIKNSGGGTLLIPGILEATQIVLPSNIILKGTSKKSTLKQKSNSNVDFIKAENNAINISLEDITVDGNKDNNTSDILVDLSVSTHTNTRFHMKNVYIYNAFNTALRMNGMDNVIQSLHINSVLGKGFINNASDSFYQNVIISYCHGGGIVDNGGATRWVNCKVYLCNKNNPNQGAWTVIGHTNMAFVNCEAQENYGHGFYIKDCSSMTFDNCIADSNGITTDKQELQRDITKPQKNGFEIINSNLMSLIVMGNDFRYTMVGGQKNQNIGVHIDSNCDNIVVIQSIKNNEKAFQDDTNKCIISNNNTLRTGGITINNPINSPLNFLIAGLMKYQFSVDSKGDLIVNNYSDTGESILNTPLKLYNSGSVQMGVSNGALGFFGATPDFKPVVGGAKGGNVALASLITQLAKLGLITNNTTD